ncbi:MAG: CBS domain-containing protein [bacterium]
MRNMKVRDYMTSTVLVQATDPAREALENMALGDVRLPVVDADGRLEGVVSDRISGCPTGRRGSPAPTWWRPPSGA